MSVVPSPHAWLKRMKTLCRGLPQSGSRFPKSLRLKLYEVASPCPLAIKSRSEETRARFRMRQQQMLSLLTKKHARGSDHP